MQQRAELRGTVNDRPTRADRSGHAYRTAPFIANQLLAVTDGVRLRGCEPDGGPDARPERDAPLDHNTAPDTPSDPAPDAHAPADPDTDTPADADPDTAADPDPIAGEHADPPRVADEP